MSTIALGDHQMRSIRRWLHEIPECADLPIYVERARSLVRPSLGLKSVDASSMQHGRLITEERTPWQIDVMGRDIWETKRLSNTITGWLNQARRIPLRLFDWPYPVAHALGAAGDTTYRVAVSALDYEGNESLPAASSVDAVAGAEVTVVWPEWPAGTPIATGGWRIYGARPGEDLALWASVAAQEPSPPERWYRHTLDFGSGSPASTDAPAATSDMFANRLISVESITSRDVEHPDRDGIWNSFISVVTCLYGARLLRPGLPPSDVPDVMRTIEVEVTPP